MVLGAPGQNHLALAEVSGITINGHCQWSVMGNIENFEMVKMERRTGCD